MMMKNLNKREQTEWNGLNGKMEQRLKHKRWNHII